MIRVTLFIFTALLIPACGLAQTTQSALDSQLRALDQKVASIQNITADFEQTKTSPMLRKPLVSRGTIRATQNAMLWQTNTPQPSFMRIDESAAAIYYPLQKTEEIYPITGQLGSLAASPLPRLAQLQQHFSLAADTDAKFDPAHQMALKLTPIEASLAEHVDNVRVLLDADRGFMIRCEIADPDGDVTVITFANVQTNGKIDPSQLQIALPADAKIVRPLEGMPTDARK